MSAKSVLAFRAATPKPGAECDAPRREPTEAEREFVRARAREAAREIFEAELRASVAARIEVSSCE